MGHQLTDYKGTVVFIDLLGFGALTNNKINLSETDIEPWVSMDSHPKNHHYLAANILVEFRSILQMLDQKFNNVKIAQLSDCFFAWSSSTIDVLELTQKFMWMAIERGILCRGGLATGNIIETGNNHNHGRLILGDAVTKAVGLEGLAKGARILTEQELPNAIFNEDEPYSKKVQEFIQPFENPLDYEIYDEFKWYLWKDLSTLSEYGPSYNSKDEKISMTKERLKLDNHILYSPKFAWNSKNSQGMVHLKATSIFLSDDTLLNIHHEFSRRGVPENGRTKERILHLNNVVEDDQGYFCRDLIHENNLE